MRPKVLLLLVFFLVSCDYIPSGLKEDDITQYITAYQNLAEVSPELEAAKATGGHASVFTCPECRALMETAVVEAGYGGLESFLIMDLRMSYTMRYVLYLQLTQLVSSAGEDIPMERLCEKRDYTRFDEDSNRQFDEYCGKAVLYTSYIEKLSQFVSGLVEYLFSKADFDIVAEHFDDLHAAITDPSLVSDLNRSGRGEWDD